MRQFLSAILIGLAMLYPGARGADNGIEPGDAGRIIGKPEAPITIIEYGSLTCIHCAHFTTTVIPEVIKNYVDTGKAKIIFRDYPLNEPALHAAILARCAPPDHFFNFINALYGNLEGWAFKGDPEAGLRRMAKLGGFSDEKYDACLADKKLDDAVLAQQKRGSDEYGVNETPYVLVNGTRVQDTRSFDDFNRALKPYL